MLSEWLPRKPSTKKKKKREKKAKVSEIKYYFAFRIIEAYLHKICRPTLLTSSSSSTDDNIFETVVVVARNQLNWHNFFSLRRRSSRLYERIMIRWKFMRHLRSHLHRIELRYRSINSSCDYRNHVRFVLIPMPTGVGLFLWGVVK